VGLDPQDSGFRLLPVIAGLIVGAGSADRIAARIGVKLTVAAGFAVAAAGSALGATMTVTSGDGLVAVWTFVVGAGSGLAFATAASTALVELPVERSGVASGLLQAIVKLGPAFSASILGSVLNSTYRSQVDLTGLPLSSAVAVKTSVFSGIAVAQQLGSPALLASARTAFVSGIDHSVQVAAGIAVVGLVLALIFLPQRSTQAMAVGGEGMAPGSAGEKILES
jgi:MFS family permease